MGDNSKFKTKRGLNTVYAFHCGYIERKEIDADNRATLELDCIYHVKGYRKGVHFWEVFEANELPKARKFFNNCLKG
jgi:hypothetical protein